MGEYERSERIGADIERTANSVPRLPPSEPQQDEPKFEDGEENEADPGPINDIAFDAFRFVQRR